MLSHLVCFHKHVYTFYVLNFTNWKLFWSPWAHQNITLLCRYRWLITIYKVFKSSFCTCLNLKARSSELWKTQQHRHYAYNNSGNHYHKHLILVKCKARFSCKAKDLNQPDINTIRILYSYYYHYWVKASQKDCIQMLATHTRQKVT